MDDTLEVGDVFLSISPELCGDSPHYHIVVYKDSNTEDILVVHTTKEIDKVKARCMIKENVKFDYLIETMVKIDNSHCESLIIESAIDCNKAILKPVSFFIKKQYYKKCLPIKEMKIIDIIKNAIKKSPVITQNIIDLI
jgi:hypothetical protein